MFAQIASWFNPRRPAPLPDEQLTFWRKNGYLVLPGFFTEEQVDAVNALVDRLWRTRAGSNIRHPVDMLTGRLAGQSLPLCSVPSEARSEVYKLNNLFVDHQEIRALALATTLKGILGGLLQDEPIICNSLNLEKGSEQPFHFDTWYMPPPVDGQMVAAWFALEDVHEDAGPLIYYPGSHAIPAYRFSTGRLNEHKPEMDACITYINRELAARKLTTQTFAGRKGDVFLWHAQLFHGGLPIKDPDRTRKSLVVHYWRKGDVRSRRLKKDQYGSVLATPLREEPH